MPRPTAYQVRKQFAVTPHTYAVARVLDCHPRYVHEVIARGTYEDPPVDRMVVGMWDASHDLAVVVDRTGFDREYVLRVLRKSRVAREMHDLRDAGFSSQEIAERVDCPAEDVRALTLLRPRLRTDVPPQRQYVSDEVIRRQYGQTRDVEAVAGLLNVEVDRVRKVVPCR